MIAFQCPKKTDLIDYISKRTTWKNNFLSHPRQVERKRNYMNDHPCTLLILEGVGRYILWKNNTQWSAMKTVGYYNWCEASFGWVIILCISNRKNHKVSFKEETGASVIYKIRYINIQLFVCLKLYAVRILLHTSTHT